MGREASGRKDKAGAGSSAQTHPGGTSNTRIKRNAFIAAIGARQRDPLRNAGYSFTLFGTIMPSTESSPRQTILVVCFGNLCRSPMAEAFLRHRLPTDQWEVISAGTHAIGDDPPTDGSREAMAHLAGLDISRQRSSLLTVDALRRSDYIFTMSRRQALDAAALLPTAAPRIRLLGAFVPATSATRESADPGGGRASKMEIPDPMGADTEAYEACCMRLVDCTNAVVAWLEAGAPAVEAPRPITKAIDVP